ncbi:hypothetical protein BGX31_003729, partial [Mortierella sp. GBA43]
MFTVIILYDDDKDDKDKNKDKGKNKAVVDMVDTCWRDEMRDEMARLTEEVRRLNTDIGGK